MPWRGPSEPGEFPTLGYLVGEWIEEHCVVPDGPLMGKPYLLTPEMWNHLLWAYRLRPGARDSDGPDAFVYGGTQLVRPQKWGKDPFGACRCVAHALGPVLFGGWDACGEPVGIAHPSPWIAVAATAEDQTDNTYRPIVTMLQIGPLADTPGLDVGDTRTKLPGIGWIDPVTASAKARLGGRFTYASMTESGLLYGEGPTGGLTLAKVLKRNVAGMGGMWSELTNAWDPTENSAAQRTHDAKSPDVFVDYRPPRRRVPLDDELAVLAEVIYLYGDSARANGGWVPERRIVSDIMNPATGESEARRFFLNEITAGARDAIDPIRWDALARDEDPLRPGEPVALGFDGSRSRDGTSLRICRIRDGRLFHGRLWIPADCPGGTVPRGDVDQAVTDAFDAYEVLYLFMDPYHWQDAAATWAGRWPKRVVEFPTNSEQRMDKAITRFLTAFRTNLTHDGNPDSSQHAKNAALAKGKLKPAREGDAAGVPVHYLRVVKKREGLLIDDFVAGILAYEARAQAIEDGALVPEVINPPATAPSAAAGDDTAFWRPAERLTL